MIQAFYAKLSKRERLVFFVTIGFIFMLIMDQLVMGPILSQLKLLDSEIESKTQTMTRNLRILSYQTSILGEKEDYNAYWNTQKRTQQEIISEHLREVETLAGLKSVAIIKIEAGEIIEHPLAKEYQILIDCEGTLPNILGFMKIIEESNFVFQIQKYTLTPKSKGSKIIKSSMTISRMLIPAEKSGADTEKSEPAGKESEVVVGKVERVVEEPVSK